eukprot:1069016-Rhodomonas_salina.3
MLSELTRHVRSVSYPDGRVPASQICCLAGSGPLICLHLRGSFHACVDRHTRMSTWPLICQRGSSHVRADTKGKVTVYQVALPNYRPRHSLYVWCTDLGSVVFRMLCMRPDTLTKGMLPSGPRSGRFVHGGTGAVISESLRF